MSKIDVVIDGADLFAGAGGTSTGLISAVQELGWKIRLTAVNHWEKALKTHEANYPWAKHIPADIEAVNPLEAIPGGHLDILVASPECTHYSRAAGGRPKNEQKRASAWAIFRWLEFLNVDSVLIENVPEFTSWGALDTKGHPIKARKGEIYRAWLRSFRAHGYTVEAKVLNAADYGAPTSRSRLFVAAKKGRGRPAWPVSTYSKQGWPLKKWRAAREIIDWSLQGESIFSRKRPLSPRTIRRIMEGLKRFGGQGLRPFIILMEHSGGIKDIEEPLPTITTAKGGAFGLATPLGTPQPFIVAMENVNRLGRKVKSIDDPLWTITAKGAMGIAQPFILSYHGGNGAEKRVSSTEQPIATIDTSNRFAVVEPFIVPNFGEHEGQNPRTHSVEEPLPSVTSHGAGNLIQPFILPLEGIYRRNKARSIEDPLGTITQNGGGNLIQPFLVEYYGNGGAKSVDKPLGTITTKDRYGLVKPYVLRFNGIQDSQVKGSACSIDEPLPTIATQSHLGLVQPQINGRVLDIKFRMLQPKELAGATGFPENYKFLGTKTEVVKQIGNAVVVDIAKALCFSLLRKS